MTPARAETPGSLLRSEAVVRAAAVADDHLELGEALEHVAVGQELPGEVLLGQEAELVVMRYHPVPRVQ